MASLVLGFAGAAVGNAILPGLGGSIGWSIGAAAGNLLFPDKKPSARLHDLHLQGSSYGANLKIIYGTVRIAGNVIWETDLQEHVSGGKGGKDQGGQATYTASFDVALTETLVVGVHKIWAGGRLNYDSAQTGGDTVPFTLYDGNPAQLPDPTEEAVEGAGFVPAYRGISRVVFADWDMTLFGNSIPQLSFELATKEQETGPIVRAAEYHDEPYDSVLFLERWAWRWTEGPVGSQFPVITKWAMDGSDIRVRVMNLATVYTYTNPDLVASTIDVAGPDDVFGDSAGVGGGNYYWPVGPYVYADDSVAELWQWNTGEVVGAGLDYATVAAGSASIGAGPSEIPHAGSNFAFDAGIDAAEKVWSTILTQDGTHCFIFTSVGGSQATKWYDIVDGTIARSGTVSGSVSLGAGRTGQIYGLAPYVCSMFENNAEWCWTFTANAGTPTLGVIKLFKITGSVFAFDSIGGTCNAADPGYGGNNVFSSCVYVPQDGYCGVVVGTSLVLFSRFAGPAVTYLDEVVGDICDRAGLSSAQYNVTALAAIPVDGYVIEQQTTCRAAIEMLMPVYFFDAVERDGVIVFVLRGGPSVVTFSDDDLAAHMDSEELPSLLTCVHTPDSDLPSILNLAYMNLNGDYQVNTQTWQRMTGGSRDTRTVSVPIVLDDDHAKKIVDSWGWNSYTERDTYTWQSSRKYAAYEPTDVVTVQGKVLRITKKTEGATGVIRWEGVVSRGANFVQAGAGGAAKDPSQTIPVSQPSQVVLLDIPLLQDDDSPNGFYAAMAGTLTSSYAGGGLFKSFDGTTYERIAVTPRAHTIGTATTALGDYQGANVFDEGNVVRVTIGPGGGTLTSTTADAVMNGANEGLIGSELVQWKNATLVLAGVYDLSGLLRGRRGTEWAIPTHLIDEQFVAFDPALMNPTASFSELNTTEYYKGVTAGRTLAGATAQTFANMGAALRPYSPTFLGGGCDAAGNVTGNWLRRTRIGGGGNFVGPKPLSEATEAYVVQIWDATYSVCARIINTTTQTFSYSAANAVTDFGALQHDIFWTVGQVGSNGLGVQSRCSSRGGGSTNTLPLAPISPYASNPVISPPTPPGGGGSRPINTTLVSGSRLTFSPVVGEVYVAKFTTGAAGTGTISMYEYGGPPVLRHGVISTDTGGLSVVSIYGEMLSNTLTFHFSALGLSPLTVYYFVSDFGDPSIWSFPAGTALGSAIDFSTS